MVRGCRDGSGLEWASRPAGKRAGARPDQRLRGGRGLRSSISVRRGEQVSCLPARRAERRKARPGERKALTDGEDDLADVGAGLHQRMRVGSKVERKHGVYNWTKLSRLDERPDLFPHA